MRTLALAGAAFVLGAALTFTVARPRPAALPLIVCESGSFEPVPYDRADPYLREVATCNAHDANGPTVKVIIID